MISFFLGFFFLSISLVQAADSQNLESAKSSQIQLEAKTVEVKPSEPKADSSVLKIETGSAKLNLLLQTWYIDDSTATAAKNTFRARRAEIKMSGNLNADSRWFVMIDPAKSLKAGPVEIGRAHV